MRLYSLQTIAAKARIGVAKSVPAIWYLPGWRHRWARKVVCSDPGLSIPTPGSGQILDIELPITAFLTKEITAPAAARNQLEKVVDLAVSKSSPNGAKAVTWCYEVTGSKDKMLTIKVYLIKKNLLEALNTEVAKAGTKIRQASIQGVTANRPLIDNRASCDGPLRIWAGLTGTVIAAFVGFIAFAEIKETQTLQHQHDLFEGQKRQLAAQALSLRQARDAAEAENSGISKDVSRFEITHKRLAILLDLTESFSDDTWISEVSFQADRLRLSGFTTADIPALITQLQNLPWTISVSLDGPISFDSFSRQNRFELLIITQLPKIPVTASTESEATQ